MPPEKYVLRSATDALTRNYEESLSLKALEIKVPRTPAPEYFTPFEEKRTFSKFLNRVKWGIIGNLYFHSNYNEWYHFQEVNEPWKTWVGIVQYVIIKIYTKNINLSTHYTLRKIHRF